MVVPSLPTARDRIVIGGKPRGGANHHHHSPSSTTTIVRRRTYALAAAFLVGLLLVASWRTMVRRSTKSSSTSTNGGVRGKEDGVTMTKKIATEHKRNVDPDGDVAGGEVAPAIAGTSPEMAAHVAGSSSSSSVGVVFPSAEEVLKSNRPMSYVMYGTAWKGEDTADLVHQAIYAGFRFIDTACQPKHYDEVGVGYGIKTAMDELKLKRSDFYIQTKFTSPSGQDRNNMPYDPNVRLEAQVSRSIFVSLRNLETTYLDSVLLHSPYPSMDDTMRAWRVLEEHVREGKVKSIGISNCYDPIVFQTLYDRATIKPRVLQNRFTRETGYDVELRNLCREYGIVYQSFWTLSANRETLKKQRWREMAKSKGLSSETLMYAYVMALGIVPLSGTKHEGHMREDVDVMLRFRTGELLSDEDVSSLGELLGNPER